MIRSSPAAASTPATQTAKGIYPPMLFYSRCTGRDDKASHAVSETGSEAKGKTTELLMKVI